MNAAIVLLLVSPLSLAEADTAESVEAGREALDNFWPNDYPWYDDDADDVRPVTPPRRRRTGGWSIGGGGSFLQWVAWIGLGLVLIAVILLLLWAFLSRKKGDDKAEEEAKSEDEDDAARIEALPFPVRSSRMDLLGEARKHYREGNFAQAVIYLFSYQLVQLDKHQVIRLTKGKTNRQYLREVGPRRMLQELVYQTMVAFEDVFFGNHPLDRVRFETCWTRLDEFQTLAKVEAG